MFHNGRVYILDVEIKKRMLTLCKKQRGRERERERERVIIGHKV